MKQLAVIILAGTNATGTPAAALPALVAQRIEQHATQRRAAHEADVNAKWRNLIEHATHRAGLTPTDDEIDAAADRITAALETDPQHDDER